MDPRSFSEHRQSQSPSCLVERDLAIYPAISLDFIISERSRIPLTSDRARPTPVEKIQEIATKGARGDTMVMMNVMYIVWCSSVPMRGNSDDKRNPEIISSYVACMVGHRRACIRKKLRASGGAGDYDIACRMRAIRRRKKPKNFNRACIALCQREICQERVAKQRWIGRGHCELQE